MGNSHYVEISGLNFSYKNHPVFKEFDFSIASDQFVAVIGANGSGKSTLLNLILGLLKPQKGEIRVLGRQAGDFYNRHQVGAALQDISFPGSERVGEIIEFVCQQYRKSEDKEQLIKDFNLDTFRHKSCGELSGGMKRRLALACAFAGQPKIVILDEPTTGLDQDSRDRLIENIKKYQKLHQALVLMISHHPSEVVGAVDQFYHVHDSVITILDPARIAELSHYKKVRFQSQQKPSIENIKSLPGNYYEVISAQSDQLVKTLCKGSLDFKDLQILPLNPEELIEAL